MDVAELSGVVAAVEITMEVFICVFDVVETVDAKFSVVDISVCIIQVWNGNNLSMLGLILFEL